MLIISPTPSVAYVAAQADNAARDNQHTPLELFSELIVVVVFCFFV